MAKLFDRPLELDSPPSLRIISPNAVMRRWAGEHWTPSSSVNMPQAA